MTYLGDVNQDALAAAFEHDPSSPGKFEGEPAYVVYYWVCSLEGYGHWMAGGQVLPAWGHTDAMEIDRLTVHDSERRFFPELEGVEIIELWESDQGFVYHETA